MNNPGAVGCLFALVWVAQNYREILIPVLQAVEQLGPVRGVAELLAGREGGPGRSAIRGTHPNIGGAYAPWSKDEPRPLSFGSRVPVSASAREPPGYVGVPVPAMLPSD